MSEPKLTLAETTARVEANSNANRVSIPSITARILRADYFTAAQGVDGREIHDLRAKEPDEAVHLVPLVDDPDLMKTALASLCTMTICVITMRNGFTFIGYSNCADPANYDAEVGERYAYENAFKQIWSHEAYLIRERLSQAPTDHVARLVAEKAELDAKLEKLTAFIAGPVFPTLPVIDQQLLASQKDIMARYFGVVATRLARLAQGAA